MVFTLPLTRSLPVRPLYSSGCCCPGGMFFSLHLFAENGFVPEQVEILRRVTVNSAPRYIISTTSTTQYYLATTSTCVTVQTIQIYLLPRIYSNFHACSKYLHVFPRSYAHLQQFLDQSMYNERTPHNSHKFSFSSDTKFLCSIVVIV